MALTMVKPGTQREAKPAGDRTARGKLRQDKSSGGRKPRSGEPHSGKRRDRGEKGDRPKPKTRQAKPRRPKPVAPITEGMLQGKEAMRTFGDLAQFFQANPEEDEPDGNDTEKSDQEKNGPTAE